MGNEEEKEKEKEELNPPGQIFFTTATIEKEQQVTLNSLRSYMKTLGSQRLFTKSRSMASQLGLLKGKRGCKTTNKSQVAAAMMIR